MTSVIIGAVHWFLFLKSTKYLAGERDNLDPGAETRRGMGGRHQNGRPAYWSHLSHNTHFRFHFGLVQPESLGDDVEQQWPTLRTSRTTDVEYLRAQSAEARDPGWETRPV